MAEPFLCELKIFGFSYPPKGWAYCNGQILPINQNQALIALLGTTYGGNGVTNFALPNLQARIPIHVGNGHVLGATGGETGHTLTTGEMAAHTHALNATSSRATSHDPGSTLLARSTSQAYASGPDQMSSLAASSLASTGGSQPHPNEQPYLVLNVCIATVGIFPSRN
ncbi:MAG: Tail Collar protein [Acidimicrobiales bacterium]|nr:Tail Collar protein [Acidimicrobiales bacterium]